MSPKKPPTTPVAWRLNAVTEQPFSIDVSVKIRPKPNLISNARFQQLGEVEKALCKQSANGRSWETPSKTISRLEDIDATHGFEDFLQDLDDKEVTSTNNTGLHVAANQRTGRIPGWIEVHNGRFWELMHEYEWSWVDEYKEQKRLIIQKAR